MLELTALLFGSYLCGSIPFGLIIAKIVAGVDIRKEGSGNIGATNVVRSLSKKWGIITFVLDGAKGIVPLYIAKYHFGIIDPTFLGFIAIIAILGHIFPVWLKFKGGKGVATSFVVFLFLDFYLGLAYIISWYFFYKSFRIVSLASIVSVIAGVLYEILVGGDYRLATFIVATIIILRHSSNIKRIFSGEEVSFEKKTKNN